MLQGRGKNQVRRMPIRRVCNGDLNCGRIIHFDTFHFGYSFRSMTVRHVRTLDLKSANHWVTFYAVPENPRHELNMSPRCYADSIQIDPKKAPRLRPDHESAIT